MIRALFAGEEVTHHGLVRVDRARLWTLPADPPALIGAAVSAETAAWVGGVGRRADHRRPATSTRSAACSPRSATAAARASRRYLQVHVSWAPTDDEALAIAYDQWRTNVFDAAGLLGPRDCRALRRGRRGSCGPRTCAERCSSPPIRPGTATGSASSSRSGFDGVWIHHVGREQNAFIDTFGEHVVPRLRKVRR